MQNFELSFRSLYDSVQSYASALNAAKVSLEACERSDLAAAQLRYEQGTISENALHTAEDELYTAQDTVSGASATCSPHTTTIAGPWTTACWPAEEG